MGGLAGPDMVGIDLEDGNGVVNSLEQGIDMEIGAEG